MTTIRTCPGRERCRSRPGTERPARGRARPGSGCRASGRRDAGSTRRSWGSGRASLPCARRGPGPRGPQRVVEQRPPGPGTLVACLIWHASGTRAGSGRLRAAYCQRRDCPPGSRPDSRPLVVLKVRHRVKSGVNPVKRDDLGRHFPDPPCVVGRGLDDRACGSLVPGMQETAGCPDTRPVALLTTFMPAQDVFSWRSAERQGQAVICFPALQQGDTPSGQRWPSPPPALSLDPLTRQHPLTSCHGGSVSLLDRDPSSCYAESDRD